VEISKVSSLAAQQYAEDLSDLHEYLKEQVRIAIQQYSRAAETGRVPAPDFPTGTKVWLNAKNIKTKRPTKKLDHKFLGPFTIIKKISSHAYRLDLPPSLKSLHNVFHVDLLEPHRENVIPDRVQSPPPPIEIDDHEEYEVSAILDSRMFRKSLQYLVEWVGYEDSPEHQTWEPAKNLENSMDYVRDFHRRYPNKPKPPNLSYNPYRQPSPTFNNFTIFIL
jgi:hypothetical protein